MIIGLIEDLQLEILQYCSINDLIQVMFISKKFLGNERLWQKYLQTKFNITVKTQDTWLKCLCDIAKYQLLMPSSDNIKRLVRLDPKTWQLSVFKEISFKQIPIILTFKQFEKMPPKLYCYNRYIFFNGFYYVMPNNSRYKRIVMRKGSQSGYYPYLM